MKRLVLFILLSFLLVGCSEEKKTDTVKKENKYVNIDLMKKLSAIDEINLEKVTEVKRKSFCLIAILRVNRFCKVQCQWHLS